MCKKGVKIINVARGGVVNEMDVVEGLNSGHVGGAAFDVFTQVCPSLDFIFFVPLNFIYVFSFGDDEGEGVDYFSLVLPAFILVPKLYEAKRAVWSLKKFFAALFP